MGAKLSALFAIASDWPGRRYQTAMRFAMNLQCCFLGYGYLPFRAAICEIARSCVAPPACDTAATNS
jgi:hypothetical protein